MPRHLAITWNTRTLRFVHADSDRRGVLKVLSAGEEKLKEDGELSASIAEGVRQLVLRLKADKHRLLILIPRGSVDTATFSVPPATDAELPILVQNLASREITGITEQTPIDFLAGPPDAVGSRSVTAMAPAAEDVTLLKQVMQTSGCREHRILLSTHTLRAFIPEVLRIEQDRNNAADAATLILTRGSDVAEFLLCVHDLPVLSRTIRLPTEFPDVDINRYLLSEVQRSLIAAHGRSVSAEQISQLILVGDDTQTMGLEEMLTDQFDAVVAVVRPSSLLTSAAEIPEDAQSVVSGSFAALLAAVSEDARQVSPLVDFANPRRPPPAGNRLRLLAAVTAVLVLTVGGGTWYVWSQFDEIDEENARLTDRLNELNQMVKETESRRQLVRLIDTWEKNRISWPDELRDLTARIPSSPDLVVQQLSISPSGPGTAVASFRGIGRQTEIVTRMENNLRDKYHDIRIPGIREQQDGQKVTASFQATLTIRRRPISEYRPAENQSAASDDSEK